MRAKVRSIEEAHARRLASIFENAPVGVALLSGSQHVFEFANEPYLAMIGTRPLIGKSIRAALPELHGQGIYELQVKHVVGLVDDLLDVSRITRGKVQLRPPCA